MLVQKITFTQVLYIIFPNTNKTHLKLAVIVHNLSDWFLYLDCGTGSVLDKSKLIYIKKSIRFVYDSRFFFEMRFIQSI